MIFQNTVNFLKFEKISLPSENIVIVVVPQEAWQLQVLVNRPEFLNSVEARNLDELFGPVSSLRPRRVDIPGGVKWKVVVADFGDCRILFLYNFSFLGRVLKTREGLVGVRKACNRHENGRTGKI